ncbi:MAG: cache domain-containing protein, partial [Oscillospiraceae bacterium]|nr:cache domain-containing protein [Oscillospiraceae bacterium]
MTIRAKILVIVLAFFAFLGSAFTIYSIFTTGNYKRLRLEGIEKTVEFEAEKVNKKITGIELGALHFAISGLICREEQSLEVGELSVLEFLRDFPDAEGGGFWFEPYAFDGKTKRTGIYAFYDRDAGFFVLDETMYVDGALNIDEYDYHSMSWYREVMDTVTQADQVVWTMPYIDDSGARSLMTTAGAGIFDEYHNLIGTSNIDWKIEDVVAELTAIKPTEHSFVLLCLPERDYIISNTYNASFDANGS